MGAQPWVKRLRLGELIVGFCGFLTDEYPSKIHMWGKPPAGKHPRDLDVFFQRYTHGDIVKVVANIHLIKLVQLP